MYLITVMTSLSKKIRKIKKDTKNCLVLGTFFGDLNNSHEAFNSLFVLSDEQQVKKKNIIYREDLNNINLLPDIDFVIVDIKYFELIKNISSVLRKNKCFLMTEGTEPPHKEIYKFLKNEQYYVTWVDKKFCFWEPKIK